MYTVSTEYPSKQEHILLFLWHSFVICSAFRITRNRDYFRSDLHFSIKSKLSQSLKKRKKMHLEPGIYTSFKLLKKAITVFIYFVHPVY